MTRRMPTPSTGKPLRRARRRTPAPTRHCGLCRKTERVTKTECCDRWICDDEDEYVVFSYARNSCYRNHRRFTLCGTHHAEGHDGNWKECEECLKDTEMEMYAWWGTNEYNFEKLENPPAFRPTFCAGCHRRIILPDGGYSRFRGNYLC